MAMVDLGMASEESHMNSGLGEWRLVALHTVLSTNSNAYSTSVGEPVAVKHSIL